ncbi:HEAT repeat domain-containing protein [Tuwongella immobilis]|uniref:HEAT repeat domain-containing protein n=1 Tax=Tuwongella immobilis TaxID=692036 RepID=A0A6C2YLM1_9BACT|nr:HEAT repeat domain-containing protein [Tuwongella immobilis]VIP01812.1 Putative uncharacterized protein OS=uncultured Planctomycetales bacterium HF0130_29M04 PE=4 SV=1 [Tuwongella immobilis]VTR99525.1 Putative uncharacterized protein OS=uncultured Planctomycetales bacterium HF0130_29M04 PE=4 SV=1 [Tuwongella immobilis]
MKRLAILTLLMGMWGQTTTETAAAETNAEASQKQAKATQLVSQLGDPLWRKREAASLELVKLGRYAKEALVTGSDSGDPEVSRRCQQILPLALQADRKSRVERFLADPKSIDPKDVPGLSRFLKEVGEDEGARDLYVEMLRKHDNLLELLDGDVIKLSQTFNQRVQQLYNQVFGGVQGRVNPEAIDIATLMFIGTDVEQTENRVFHSYLGNLLFQQTFRNAISDPKNSAMRRVMFNWLDKRQDPGALSQAISLAVQTNIKEMLPLAVKTLENKNVQPHVRAMSMLAVGKFGGKEQIPLLLKQIEDKTTLSQFQINGVNGTTQFGDVALAMAIHLKGLSPKDFGFDMLQNQPLNFTYFYNLGFSSQANRDKALKKWQESHTGQPK